MINRIERPLANDHPDGSFSVHLFLHRPKTQNLRIIGRCTHNLLGLKTLSFALLLSSTKIWIKGPQIGSDMPSALGLVSSKLTFKSWISTSEKRGPSCPNWSHGGGYRGFGQCPKENVFLLLMSSLIIITILFIVTITITIHTSEKSNKCSRCDYASVRVDTLKKNVTHAVLYALTQIP